MQAGFSRVNITPPLGTPLTGYYNVVECLAEIIMDELEVNALAVSDDKNKVVISSVCTICTVPTNKADPSEIPWAQKVMVLHNAGRDNEIEHDPERIKVGHVVARASRMLRLQNTPDTYDIPVCAVRIGPAAFVGIAGEPFNNVGVALKEQSPYEITLPCCCTNGYQGYYPMMECYEEGGYEAGSSPFAPGCAEKLIDVGLDLMNKLK